MTWLSWVMALTVYGGYVAHAKNPTRYSAVGSASYVNVVNRTADSVPIGAIAREVDRSIRFMGFVQPQDSVTFKIPYGDTWVMLLVGGQWGGSRRETRKHSPRGVQALGWAAVRCVCGRSVQARWRDVVLTVGIILAMGFLDVTFLERFALSVILFCTIYL